MSLDIEERLRIFLASSPPAQRQIPVVVIDHPALTRRFAFWWEPYPGQVVTTDHGPLDVQYAPMMIELAGSEANLDQEYQLTLDTTDVQDEFRDQLDRIPIDTQDKVRLFFYEFMSDDLDNEQTRGALEAETISFVIGTATIKAISPRYNVLSTGEKYEPGQVPMLRAFY